MKYYYAKAKSLPVEILLGVDEDKKTVDLEISAPPDQLGKEEPQSYCGKTPLVSGAFSGDAKSEEGGVVVIKGALVEDGEAVAGDLQHAGGVLEFRAKEKSRAALLALALAGATAVAGAVWWWLKGGKKRRR